MFSAKTGGIAVGLDIYDGEGKRPVPASERKIEIIRKDYQIRSLK